MMSATDALARLLLPITPAEFHEHYVRRAYFSVSRRPGSYHQILTVDDLDHYLQSQRLSTSLIEVFRSGATVPVEEWSRVENSPSSRPERVALTEKLFDLYTAGATIVLNGAQYSIPRLGGICRQIACELHLQTQANVYITPPHSQCFPRHADAHEVLAIQVHGTKSWRLFPENKDAVNVELATGDLLYIPRGLEHEAASHTTASIHVTLGLVPVYAFQLIEELAAVAKSHPGFQQPVNLFPADGSQLANANFSQRIQELLSEVSLDQLILRRIESLLVKQQKGWERRLPDVIDVPQLSVESVVCVRSDLEFRIAEEGPGLLIEFAGKIVNAPLFLRPCVERLLNGQTVTLGDLPGLISDHGRIELVGSFVRSGIVRIVKL